jgi:hypothetical protein
MLPSFLLLLPLKLLLLLLLLMWRWLPYCWKVHHSQYQNLCASWIEKNDSLGVPSWDDSKVCICSPCCST